MKIRYYSPIADLSFLIERLFPSSHMSIIFIIHGVVPLCVLKPNYILVVIKSELHKGFNSYSIKDSIKSL